MTTREDIADAYDHLRAALIQRLRCAGNAGHEQTEVLNQYALDQIQNLTRIVRTSHANIGCQHAPKIRAQLETPTDPTP